MTAAIRTSNVDEWRTSCAALLEDHYQEVALNKQLMVLAPDWTRYNQLELGGGLVVLCAFVGDVPVGYSVNIATTHLHYRDLLVLHNDVLFVAKEHRASRIGLELIRATEAVAHERGCQMVAWHAKQGTTLERLLPRLGYAVQDVIFTRGL